jgi:uncharacterized protein with FMN-binding domain
MFRVLLAIGGTIAGLAALLSFKSHSGAALPTIAASAGASPGPVATASSPARTSSPASAPSRPAAGPSTGPPHPGSSPAPKQEVLTGQVFQTRFGPMQVQVTLVNHKITMVTVLQETNLGSLSTEIDARAIPQLNQETLTAQSARIDAVSGATYTSTGYISSLQSALDQA